MLAFFKNFKLIVPQIKNSLLPALIFACALLSYFIYGEISLFARNNLHYLFWFSCLSCFGTLVFFNRRKPFFFILTIMLSYMFINWLKRRYSLDYLSTESYINLCFFAPLNLCLFYFLPHQKLFHKSSFWLLLLILTEIALGEYLTQKGLFITFNSQVDGINLNSLSVLLFLGFLTAAFFKCSLSGYIDDTALFFSAINIFAGFYYSANSTALSIFFAAASLTAVLGIIKDIRYALEHDFLTGLSSRRTYLKESSKFPLKYSLAVICLDNYPHLYKAFGRIRSQNLIKMLAYRLAELEPDNPLYRYSTDEFLLIFKNDTLKQSFEKLDKIRREIAASEFMFSQKQKGIKITISGCVSEKKRSDSNSTEVLLRARKTLQKTYEFTQNLISKA